MTKFNSKLSQNTKFNSKAGTLSQNKVLAKFTIVSNVFVLPIEQVMLKVCAINAPFRRFKLIAGLTADEKVIVTDESDGSGIPAIFEGESLLETSASYDIDNFDLTISPNGWLVFDTSRTKIRECLFQIYKLIPEQTKFYRPTFIDHSLDLRIGMYYDIIDIMPAKIIYPTSHDALEIGRTIDGGGGGSFYYHIIPVPTKRSTWDIITILKNSEEYCNNIVCIISRYGYYYSIVKDESETSIQSSSDGPIIDFLHLDCDVIVFNNRLPTIEPQLISDERSVRAPTSLEHEPPLYVGVRAPASLEHEQFIYYLTWKLSCQNLITYIKKPMQLYTSILKDRQVSGFIETPKMR
jgi:hypothetical protein